MLGRGCTWQSCLALMSWPITPLARTDFQLMPMKRGRSMQTVDLSSTGFPSRPTRIPEHAPRRCLNAYSGGFDETGRVPHRPACDDASAAANMLKQQGNLQRLCHPTPASRAYIAISLTVVLLMPKA